VVAGVEHEPFGSAALQGVGREPVLAEPLACADILGRSLTERTIERFLDADVEIVSVLAPSEKFLKRAFSSASEKVKVQIVGDVWSAMSHELERFSQIGIDHSFVSSASLYAETDVLDLFYFHRESRRRATRGQDSQGPLDLWMVDCAKARGFDPETLLMQEDGSGSSYFVAGYVNRMRHPRDLRRLVSDALQGHCAMRPAGREIKPGIWVGEGADIHRRSRIVAPAYIGCASKVREDTLITRCSSIERDCYVDCGTAIEDSSILTNTHVGMWLDVSHAVAQGNKLMSLGRDVMLEVSDSSIMRFNGSFRKEVKRGLDLGYRDAAQPVVAEVEPQELSAQKSWQLGASPIQG